MCTIWSSKFANKAKSTNESTTLIGGGNIHVTKHSKSTQCATTQITLSKTCNSEWTQLCCSRNLKSNAFKRSTPRPTKSYLTRSRSLTSSRKLATSTKSTSRNPNLTFSVLVITSKKRKRTQLLTNQWLDTRKTRLEVGMNQRSTETHLVHQPRTL